MNEHISTEAKGILYLGQLQHRLAQRRLWPCPSCPLQLLLPLPWLRCALQRTVGRLKQEHFIDGSPWQQQEFPCLTHAAFLFPRVSLSSPSPMAVPLPVPVCRSEDCDWNVKVLGKWSAVCTVAHPRGSSCLQVPLPTGAFVWCIWAV